MCSLHLTLPSGAVGSRHCGARGAVGGSVPCSRVLPQSWTLPARAGIQTHNLGLPQVSSPTLYPLDHDCPVLPILAQSREQLDDHRDLVLRHLSQLGLQVNWEKSNLSPVQSISFLGGELDSVHMTARLTEERASEFLQRQECGTTETVSEAPGAYGIRSCSHATRIASYETTSALATLPGPEVGMGPRYTVSGYHPAVSPLPQPLDGPCLSTGRGTLRTSVLAYCCQNRCLQHGLGHYMQRQAALGLWTGLRLLRHINCLELWAVHLALRQFRPLLLGKHVLVRMDNTAAVSFINRLGGIRSHRMSQLARHLLLWSHTQFKSLRAVHILGKLNRAADALSRQI